MLPWWMGDDGRNYVYGVGSQAEFKRMAMREAFEVVYRRGMPQTCHHSHR